MEIDNELVAKAKESSKKLRLSIFALRRTLPKGHDTITKKEAHYKLINRTVERYIANVNMCNAGYPESKQLALDAIAELRSIINA